MSAIHLPGGVDVVLGPYDAQQRITSVKVGAQQATTFTYSDQPRKTIVRDSGGTVTEYVIADNGAILRATSGTELPSLTLGGQVWILRGSPAPVTETTLTILAQDASGVNPIERVMVLKEGTEILYSADCAAIDCEQQINWTLEPGNHAPGSLDLEVVVYDSAGRMRSERFTVDVPVIPPPAPGELEPPSIAEVREFRANFGLPFKSDIAIGADIDADDMQGTMATWGVPLDPEDVAELQLRQAYIRQAHEEIASHVSPSSGYAGFYIDHSEGGLIYVGFTHDQETQVDALKQFVPLAPPERIVPFPVTPTHSLADLQLKKAEMKADPAIGPKTASIVIVPATNGFSIGAPAQFISDVTALLPSGYAAHVFEQEMPKVGPVAGFDGTRFANHGNLQAGDALQIAPYGPGQHCTAGFGAWQKDIIVRGRPTTVFFNLTAGHCVSMGGLIQRANNVAGAAREPLNNVVKNLYQPAPNVFATAPDGAAFVIDSDVVSRNIHRGPFDALGLRSTIDAAGIHDWVVARPGQIICTSGVSTNRPACGPVLSPHYPTVGGYQSGTAVDVTPFWTGGVNVRGGDSGGPVYMPDPSNTNLAFAVGLVSAGMGLQYNPELQDPHCVEMDPTGDCRIPRCRGEVRPGETDVVHDVWGYRNFECPVIGSQDIQPVLSTLGLHGLLTYLG